MKALKRILKKFIYGYSCDSDTYIGYLKKKGAKIGEDVHIFHIRNAHIDEVNPHLLTIGNHVNIVGSCILTHDYSWSVIKSLNGKIIGNQQPVVIGNNVFIGYGSIILGGSQIGDNVVIGAHSVITGIVEPCSVYAGVPARKICSLSEFIQKRGEKQLEEAVTVVKKYYESYHKLPPMDLMHEYFFLFTDCSQNENIALFKDKLKLCDNYDMSIKYLNQHRPLFENYNSFLNYCMEKL